MERTVKYMKRIEISKWLKAITILVAIMGIVLLVFMIPEGVKRLILIYPAMKPLYWQVMSYIWIIALACYGVFGKSAVKSARIIPFPFKSI